MKSNRWHGRPPAHHHRPLHILNAVAAAIACAAVLTGTVGCSNGAQINDAWAWGSTQYEERVESAWLARMQRQQEQRWQRQAELAQARATKAGRTTPGEQAEAHVEADADDQAASDPFPANGGVETPSRVRFTDSAPVSSVRNTGAPPLGLYGHANGVEAIPTGAQEGADNVAQVTLTTEGADFDPAISPDGRQLAFASTRHRRTSDIYIQAVGGTTVRQLTSTNANDVMPTFSPDGRHVAFASDRGGNWDIYLVSVNGGKARQLTTSGTQDVHPSFSPDGRQLIFCSFGTQSGQWELWLIDVDNPANRRHIGYGLFPRWSPVDDRIVFQKARQRGQRWFSVWTIEIEDNEARRPTEVVASANAAAITPAWSPDGEHLVFTTVLDPENNGAGRGPREADVWIMDVEGRHRINLTGGRFANVQPIWSGDGTIYFVSNRGSNRNESVWSVRPGDAMQLARPDDGGDGDRTAIVGDEDEEP